MVGGELFVPKIPSMNIMDLAKAIDPECKTEIVGIRPGEKLHEIMVTKDDARKTLEYKDHYVVQPDFEYWGHRCKENGGKRVAEDFEYNSGTNPWFLTIDEMREMLEGIAI
jgi:UDP-N-acetylglucosamine 4,6-dehydratase